MAKKKEEFSSLKALGLVVVIFGSVFLYISFLNWLIPTHTTDCFKKQMITGTVFSGTSIYSITDINCPNEN